MFSIWDFFCSQKKCNTLCKAHERGFHPHWIRSRLRKSHPPASVLSVGTQAVFFLDSHYPSAAGNWNFLHLTISESISWHHPIRTRHSRSCLLAPALSHLLPLSKPPKISSHYRIKEQAVNPQKKSSSLWWWGQKICGRRWKSVPVSKSQGKWGSDKAESHRNKWPVAAKTKSIPCCTAAPLGSSSLRSSDEHRSLLRVEFLSVMNNYISRRNVRQ